ncbi:hypothetical protein AALP_AA6G173000 [Arabis alpina]|uniref:Uncharacterized protein n=1 Tax=Arabis alpina TaxID=50452 RepID=A0A087GPU2_ARAAL|nr:hypothetical protein AALP_AA6G173000 [Arabis alpina]
MSCNRIRLARDRLDIWNSEYWAAEMGGATPGVPTFNTPSILIRHRKSRRLSKVSNRSEAEVTANPSAIVVIQDSEDNTEGVALLNLEEAVAVKDDSQKIPSVTDAADMQRAGDVSAQGSVPGESSEPKGPGDVSRSNGKGKVINTGNCIVSVYEVEVQRREDRIKTLASRSHVDAAWQDVGCEMCRADSWEATASENQQSHIKLFDQACALKEKKQRLEDEVKKRNVHLEAAYPEIAELRANLEKSHLTEGRLRKERDGARRRADEIVKAQLCYRRGARIKLENMLEAQYELPPGLLENYAKEEKEYLAKIESFDIDSLSDDTLFPTSPPPPAGPPRDVASQVPERISEHMSFLSSQDNQDGDQV